MTKHDVLEEVSNLLLDSKLFFHMAPHALQSAAPYFRWHSYRQGEVVFSEGDKGTFMGIIHQGRILITKTAQNGKTVAMGEEGTGRVFGEMAVLDGEPRSATCVAESDCDLLVLTKASMDALLTEKPRIGAEILRAIAISLSRRMRVSAGRLVDRL
ncbi:MAG: cyclic nucleotide-binding domain-containing protein [Sulfuricella sp.]|nr:cyclic nucleotide-binding domain-containing protein [Sulfuricella sp.]